ncbi:hypothetical protein FRC06_003244 [Ceratobasidium sp. 370]|nr:hypothetical protein FRC06_003244 [Ceratobasidium sp. 370]
MADLAARLATFIDTTSDPELPLVPSNSSRSMSDLSGLLPIRASTPFSANHHNTPSVTASPHPIEHPVQDDAAPYGIATNEEELQATIHKVLEDMVQKNTELSQDPPQPSGSSQANSQASGSAPSGPNRVVTMQQLPDNIDDTLSHLATTPANDTELDTANNTNDDSGGETFCDTRSKGDSEPKSEHFYTAVNNSAENLIIPNTKIQYFAHAPET